MGEIFSYIGKNKKAQNKKISNDILKMLLLEKVIRKEYRKIFKEDGFDKKTIE